MKSRSLGKLSMVIPYFFVCCLMITSCGKDDPKPDQPTADIRDAVFTVSGDGNVYALDINSGSKIWSYTIPNQSRIYGSLISSNGMMYVSSIDDFKLYAFNANTGERLWDFATTDDINSYPAMSTDNKTVFVGSIDDKLYALDALTGKQKWVSSVAKDVIRETIKEKDGIVYFTSSDKNLYAVDANTGAAKWTVTEPTNRNGFFDFSIRNNTLFITSYESIYALDATSGNQKFKFSPNGSFAAYGLILGDGVVYCNIYNSIDHKNYLYSVNASTGQQIWRYEGPNFFNSAPYLKDNILYTTLNDGTMITVDAATGKQIWLKDVGVYNGSSPVVVNDKIFINEESGDGGVFALDKSNGNLKWKFNTTGAASPTISVVSSRRIYNPSFSQ